MQVVERTPDDIFPHLTLADTLAEMDKIEEARVEFGKVLRFNPE